MLAVQTEILPDDTINEVLPLWKNQDALKQKLSKISNGAEILIDWISRVVEYNLKSEMIISSRRRIPELERMIKHQCKMLSDLTSESANIEEILNKTKMSLDDQDCEDCSELSLTSKPYMFIKSPKDDRVIFYSTVHRGTASGGIMQHSARSSSKSPEFKAMFPNFESENLYGEVPGNKNEDVDDIIIFEGKSEMVGCCRMRFFCF